MKYSLRCLALCVTLLILAQSNWAQVSNYSFSQASNTYTALATSTNLIASGWDDNVAAATLPFTFNFNNTNYTSVNVSSNGFITFGTAPGNTLYFPINSAGTFNGIFSGFGRDLIDNGTTNPIRIGTIGTTPNRVFIIQWTNARRWNNGGIEGDVLNFQIRLYETSNVIECRYGTCTATSTTLTTCQVGLRGATNADFSNRSSASSWASTVAGTSNSANISNSNTILPASGLSFLWTPPAPCSGTPNTPIVPTTAEACQNAGVLITATGASIGQGITFQWQQSANGTSGWANATGGSGATTLNYTTSVISTITYYRLVTTCSGSGLTSTSAVVVVTPGDCSPPNDMCFEALPITLNSGSIPVTTTYATNDSTDPSCGGNGIVDVWFSFVYAGGTVTIVTSGTMDTRLAVYAGCGGTQVACDDDAGPGNLSLITLSCAQLQQGQTYYIQAGGYNAIAGSFGLSVTSVGASGCTNPLATNYSGCATTDDGSCVFPPLSASFTNIPSGTNCLNIQLTSTSTGNIVGYNWSIPNATPSTSTLQNPIVSFPGPGVYPVSLTVTDASSNTANVSQNISVQTGNIMVVDITPDNLPQQTSWAVFDENNTVVASGNSNDATFCIGEGCHRFEMYDSGNNGICCTNGSGSYRLYLNGIQVAQGGQFGALDIRDIACPQGTSCNNPIVVGEGSFTTPFPNAWYQFTPPANGQYKIETCGLAACDTKLWIYDYCQMANFDDTNEATITYNDDFCGVQSQITPILEGGQTYYIRVGDADNACGSQNIGFTISYLGPIQGCMDPLACNYMLIAEVPGPCYYNGSPECTDLGPDLEISLNDLFNSLVVNTINGTDGCLVQEGCLQGLGTRQILRFTTTIWNIGNQDYFIGVPNANNTQFEWDPCHGHYHYEGYAEYLLYNQAGVPMPEIGFKNGFCVLDLFCPSGFTAKYTCGNMGITAGCRDTYGSSLACQWIDITNVPAGEYYLVVRTNWDQAPDNLGRYELRYDNNWAQVCISFGRDANNNIINFTKNINACPVIEDCVGQPFGDVYPDCAGNCPGTVKSADVVVDYLLNELDVHHYLDAAVRNVIVPVSTCTDLNQDGIISVAEAAYLEECIHAQLDAGVNPFFIEECGWDEELFDNNKSATIGIHAINTAQNYVDIYFNNPDCELAGFEFEMSGIVIESVESLLPIGQWNPHIHWESDGTKIAAVGAVHSLLPVNFSNTPILRVYYNTVDGAEVCIETITDVLDEFAHNILFQYGDCLAFNAMNASFSASQTEVCSGSQINFTDNSTGNISSWNWSFPGGTPSASTAQNPTVTYNTPGTYSVTLQVGDGSTSNTVTQNNLIVVDASAVWYRDADNDGFGNPLDVLNDCDQPTGYIAAAGDCNDTNSAVFPGATEVCNNTDDDCDTQVDEGFDNDNDGFTVCEGDCDDNNGIVYPGAFEICNNIDDDCDTQIDEGYDNDNDGFTICGGDCDDNNSNVYPGASEICGNTIDEDCSGALNNGCPTYTYYVDNDGDGFGVTANSIVSFASSAPTGYAALGGDCNDNLIGVNPAASELCFTNYDDDCDGFVNEGCTVSLIPNDERFNAINMNGSNFPTCSSLTVNLANATNSPESNSNEPMGAGQDAWYRFTANTTGVRIQASGASNDMVIELQNTTGESLAMQNALGVGATEILAYGQLTVGQQYFVVIRNFNTNAVGSASICIQHLLPSNPDYGLFYPSTCSVFKCDWTGASLYQAIFVDGENQYSHTGTSTLKSLTLFPALIYGNSYEVYVNSIFNFPNNPSVTVVGGPFTVSIGEHNDLDLRLADQCPTTRTIGSFISASESLCNFTQYEWEFTQVDVNDNIIALEPHYVMSVTKTRHMRVSWIPGVTGGNRYRVKIRPWFGNVPGEWGNDYQLLCIAGSAGLVEYAESKPIFTDGAAPGAEAITGLYPNPSDGKFVNVWIEGIETEKITVNIYDAAGKKVETALIPTSGLYNIRLDFKDQLANGLYTVEMLFDEERIVEKMLVGE